MECAATFPPLPSSMHVHSVGTSYSMSGVRYRAVQSQREVRTMRSSPNNEESSESLTSLGHFSFVHREVSSKVSDVTMRMSSSLALKSLMFTGRPSGVSVGS